MTVARRIERVNPPPTNGVYRAFTDSSWWNTPLDHGGNAPAASDTTALVAGLSTWSGKQYVVLTGTPNASPDQAQPIYFPQISDTLYTVDGYQVRIPAGAVPNGGTSPKMLVIDTTTNQAFGMTGAAYHSGSDTWTVTGDDRYYLDSEGVSENADPPGTTGNSGHRGASFALKSPRIAEVVAGVIPHRLECFINPNAIHGENNGGTFVWPMSGQDNPTSNGPLEEGMVFRIKRSVNLASFGLSTAAMVIAKCLQDYGVMITDGGGSNTTIRLEWADPFNDPTFTQAAWTALGVSDLSLSQIPLSSTYLEFVQLGYQMPGSTP